MKYLQLVSLPESQTEFKPLQLFFKVSLNVKQKSIHNEKKKCKIFRKIRNWKTHWKPLQKLYQLKFGRNSYKKNFYHFITTYIIQISGTFLWHRNETGHASIMSILMVTMKGPKKGHFFVFTTLLRKRNHGFWLQLNDF